MTLRWVLATLLWLLAHSAVAQALLDFSDDEKRRIASHGPWPMVPARDAGNRWSGNADAAALGERLFFDKRLSPDATMSCASCHDPQRGFADGLRRSQGRDEGDRNTPTLWNVGQQRWFGWGGAADSLWHQTLRALFNPREQGATPAHVAQWVSSDARYRAAWQRVFKQLPAARDADRVAVQAAKAMGAYLLTLDTPRAPFDEFRDALLAGNRDVAARYPLAAQRGLRLFIGRGNCAICHIGPLFSNGEFADIGVPFFVRPGVVDPGRHGGIEALRHGPMSHFNLLGRYNDEPRSDALVKTRHVDLQHRNFGEFKVPSLRGLAATAPFMHDGSLATLRDVVRHYSEINLERLHADGERILRPLNLDEGDSEDLVAFLRSLSHAPAVAPAQAARPASGLMQQRPRVLVDTGLKEGAGTVAEVRSLNEILRSAGFDERSLRYSEDPQGEHNEASSAPSGERLLRGPPAIHGEVDPGDVVCGIARQEQHRRWDLVGRCESLAGLPFTQQSGHSLRVAQAFSVDELADLDFNKRGLHPTRTDGIAGHPRLRVLQCDDLRETSHSRLTDSYLLALARANHGRLATLGHKLATEVAPEGKASLALI